MKKITVAYFREVYSQFMNDEITMSRMVELLNEKSKIDHSNIGSYDDLADEYVKGCHLSEGTYEGDVQTAFVCGMSSMFQLLSSPKEDKISKCVGDCVYPNLGGGNCVNCGQPKIIQA